MTIRGGDASAAATAGAVVTIDGGDGNTTGAGGATTVSGGAGGGGAATGGAATLSGGAGGGTTGAGGAATVSGGTPTDGDGGSVLIDGADGVGAASNGGDVTIDAGNSTGALEGGLVILRSGSSGASDAGYVRFDMPNDDDEHIIEFITGGTNGTTTQLLTGTQNPDTAAIAALGGSLYLRRVAAAAGSALFVNDSTAAGEGTSWAEVFTENSRTFVQGVPTGSIGTSTDISDAAPASNVTMDFGNFPTFPSTQAEMNTRTKIWFNGLLQRAGTDVVRSGVQATAFQSPTTALVATDVIAIEQWST